MIADIDAAGIDRFVLVGHSMGGLTIPEVARRIPDRIEHLVFVSCLIPPDRESIIDALPADVRELTRAAMSEAIAGDAATGMGGLDDATKVRMFCNDLDEEQTELVLAHMGAEAPRARSPIPSLGSASHRRCPRRTSGWRATRRSRPRTRIARSRTSVGRPAGSCASSSSTRVTW